MVSLFPSPSPRSGTRPCVVSLCVMGCDIMLHPFTPCCGMQLMLHPFVYHSGTRHDVAVPLHLVLRAWDAMRHNVAVPLLLTSIWDATLCCIPSCIILGRDTMSLSPSPSSCLGPWDVSRHCIPSCFILGCDWMFREQGYSSSSTVL
jgi:hypothetical protein